MDGEESVVFSPRTFAKHDQAIRYVEGLNRTRNPRDQQDRYPSVIPATWGFLAAGSTISAASGLTLGTGVVKLCDRTGTVADDAEPIDVANDGASIDGGTTGKVLPMEWVGGEWSVCECGTPGNCFICVDVVECLGATVAGATVTAKKAGVVIGTCVTDSEGHCCVDVTSGGSGSYVIYADKSGYYGSGKPVTITCPGTTDATLKITNDITKKLTITVQGCGGKLIVGATVTFNGVSHSTDSSGNAYFTVPENGTYTVTVSAPRYNNSSFTRFFISCINDSATVNLTVSSGYVCCGTCEVSKTLQVTDGCGTQTLQWMFISGTSNWWAVTPCMSASGTIITPPDCCTSPVDGNILYSYSGSCGPGNSFVLLVYTPELDCGDQFRYSDATCDTSDGFGRFYPVMLCGGGSVGLTTYPATIDLTDNCPIGGVATFSPPAAGHPGHPCGGTATVSEATSEMDIMQQAQASHEDIVLREFVKKHGCC